LLASEHAKQHVMGEVAFWRRYVPADVLMAGVVRWREEVYEEWKNG